MTQVPVSFAIDDSKREYYNTKDLLEYKREFFYGCTGKPRKIITKKNIDASDYVYANYTVKTGEWKLTDESCRKAQLLISKSWVDANYFKAKPDEKKKAALMKRRNLKITTIPENKVENKVDTIVENKVEVEVEAEEEESLEMAPPLIILEDEEKFRDSDGNIYEIETRGEKTRKGIFFLVEDVKKCFELNNLDTVLMNNKKNSYERHIHYKAFIIDKINYDSYPNKKMHKRLFLTYHGLLKVLFVSRNEKVKQFQDWAEETLFTVQMGSQEQKQSLGTRVLGISVETYRAVFNSHAEDFPCIYLISLGKMKDLRQSLDITGHYGDEETVYKYGFSKNFSERLAQHGRDYGKYSGVNIEVVYYNIIDTIYLSQAENELRTGFNASQCILSAGNRKELVCLNSLQLKDMKNRFQAIGNKYIGHTRSLQQKVQDLETQILRLSLREETLKNNLENAKLREESLKREMELQRELAIQKQEAAARIHELEKRCYEMQIQLLSNK